MGDSLHCFRSRRDDRALRSGQGDFHDFFHACSFFRQQRDSGRRRGFAQSALVAVSQSPYVGLLRTIAGIVGPLYYKIGPTALEAAYNDTRLWAIPVPGTSLDLPLLGQVLRFHVPWTGAEGSAAQPQAPDVETADPTRSVPRPLPASRPNRRLSLAEVFAAKHSEVPGVFQEIGLFAAFRALTPCLWSVWELVITGQPLLLLGASPDVCGDAVMGAVSLIAPMRFSGDFRPYCTLYDPDFKGLAAAVNAAGEADTATANSGVAGWALSFVGGGSSTKTAAINSPRLPGPISRPRPEGVGSSPLPAAAVGAPPPLRRSATAPQPTAPGEWKQAVSAQQLPAIPPFGTPITAGAAYSVPFQTQPAAERRRRRRQPAHLNSGLATRDASRSDVGLLPEACPVLIGSTNPYFTRALSGCPNALWLGAHPPLLPTPNPTALPSVPSGGGAGGLRRRTSFLQPSLVSVQEAASDDGDAREASLRSAGSLPAAAHDTASAGSGGASLSAAHRASATSLSGIGDSDSDGEGGEVQTATAAELAAATAAVLRRTEQGTGDAGFTSESAKRVRRSASAGSTGSVWGGVSGHREMMTPSSRRNKRTSSGSNATAHSAEAVDAAWPLTEISTSMLLDVGSTGEDTSPSVDSPLKAAGRAASSSLTGLDTHSVSVSSVTEETSATAAPAACTSTASVASKSSVATHVGHVARTFSPQVLRAAAAAYHASFAVKHSTRVLSPAAPLTECMPGPGETSTALPVFAMRRAAWVKPNEDVLRQLLPLRRVDEATLQERLAAGHGIHVTHAAAPISSEGLSPSGSSSGQGAGSNVAFHSMLEGHVPAVLINNALLRQHFRSLTREFLQPFEGYFSVARAASVAATAGAAGQPSSPLQQSHPAPGGTPQTASTSTGGHRLMRSVPSSAGGVQLQHSYGPYDDLADALLPAFDKAEFFAQLKRRGPPKLLAGSKWMALYRAFVAGPLFPTWFHARRAEAKQHLQYLSRALRVSAPDASLHACIVPRGATVCRDPAASSDQLYAPLSPQEANSAAASACTLWHRVRVALREAYGAAQRDGEYHAAMRRHAGVVWRWLRSDARTLVAETERTMLHFGDADSAWILKDLVGEQAPGPVASAPVAAPAAEALPDGSGAEVDFDGTQHAIARSALDVMQSSPSQGQDRAPPVAVSPPTPPGTVANTAPSTTQASPSVVGDARPDVSPPSPAVAASPAPPATALSSSANSVASDNAALGEGSAATVVDTVAGAAAQPAAAPATQSAPSNTVSAPPSPPGHAAAAPAPSSPLATSGSSTPVQGSRSHLAVQATPLPISPDVSTAHPHVSETRGQPANSGEASPDRSIAAAGALLHLPAADGSADSVILGAGGLIGRSRSLGKGPITIGRR